jgi:hypothetical protein
VIVIVNHTVMSGQVARFFMNAGQIEWSEASVSASRDGVYGHGSRITPELFGAAWAAHLRLAQHEDVRDIATHVRQAAGEYLRLPTSADAVHPVDMLLASKSSWEDVEAAEAAQERTDVQP